jgi:hypothetical protein
LEQRRAIKSGQVELNSRFRENGVSLNTVRTVYFDGRKLRGDLQREYLDRPPGAPPQYTDVSCYGCFGDLHVHCTDRIPDGGGRFAVSITDPELVDVNLVYVPDPRHLGLIPLDLFMMRHFNMEMVVGAVGSAEAQVVDDAIAGRQCWRTEYKLDEGSTARVWISPECDYSVLRVEYAFKHDRLEYLDRVDSIVSKKDGVGVWFPESCKYRRTEFGKSGEVVTREEDLAIKVVQLNQPVDPMVFSLQGISILREGAYLHWVSKRARPGPGELQWNGSGFQAPIAVRSEPPEGRSRTTRLIVCLNLAAISGLLGVVAFRKWLRLRHSVQARPGVGKEIGAKPDGTADRE